MIQNKFYGSFLLILSILFLSYDSSVAQGCSDAGFCTAGSLGSQNGNDSSRVSTIGLKLSYGSGEEGVGIIHISPELEWRFSERSTFQANIPYVITSGDLGDNSGIGDLLLNYTYRIYQNNKTTLRGTVGFKLPTGTTNEEYLPGISLPMPYQTGLGTYDLILGASLTINRWAFAAGYQGVLKNENKNTFGAVPVFAPESSEYFRSNKLVRGNDALLRLGRVFMINRTSITPGILAIYRLNKDKITQFNGTEIELEGSDGLTLNITISSIVPLNNKFSLLLEAGAPAVVRDTRADGLTRSFVAAGSLRYHF